VTSGQEEYADLAPIFAELATLDEADPRRAELREQLVTGHLRLADNVAARFRNRGENHDDLVQVARIGLVKAVDRFDPAMGHDFLSFAVPTIMGEVRRYFRDSSWAVRVPRGAKELHLAVHGASAELSQKIGSAPTPAQIAEHLGIDLEQVYEGLQIGRAYHTESLSAPVPGESAGITLADTLGVDDVRLDGIDNHEALKPLLAALPERERRILVLRFFHEMTQTKIAEKVGISQMQVSRILARTLQQLREAMTTD
jgi:RNA polymerase sigma-B factor